MQEELDEPVQVPSQATPPAPATESEGVTDDVGPGQNALAPPSDVSVLFYVAHAPCGMTRNCSFLLAVLGRT